MLTARRVLLLASGLSFALAAGCSVPPSQPEEKAPPADEDLGTATADMTTADVMMRAQQWVDLGVPYCGGVNGGTDYICGGTCSRPSEPWNNYRSDCSGYVSWCWQISSDPTTNGYMSDVAGANGWTTVQISQMQAGDAFVCNGHIKLFSKFVSATSAEIYEESDCGQVAHKAVQSFTKSGNTLLFQYDNRVYHPIRRNGIQPPVRVDGYIDSADSKVVGWAADLDHGTTALTVDLYFGGAPGTGFQVTDTASIARPDVATALGIGPNHGYSVDTPAYYCDTQTHPVHAVAKAVDGTPVELKSSPKNLTCAPQPSPPGLLRHVTALPVLTAWSFSLPKELAWMTTADKATHKVGSDWPDAEALGKTSDGAVWVVDGTERRHVINPASFTAWGFDATKVVAWTDAEAAKYTQGIDLPAKPILLQEIGNPAVYVLDADPAAPDPSTGTGAGTASGGTTTGTGSGSPTSGAGGGGGSTASVGPLSKPTCAASPVSSSTSGSTWAFGAVAAGLAGARRRRRAHRR